jgi:hypothetical protein
VLFYVLFVCKCVQQSGDNPIAVNKYIIYIYICTGVDPDFVRPETYTIAGVRFKKKNTKLSMKVFTENKERNHNKLQI